MKKIICIVLILSFSFLSLKAQNKKNNSEDVLKDLVIVDKVEAIPELVKDGYNSIKKEDAASFLKFLSSDLLEGRDTATRGYKIASEFVATMFEKWGIKPAGDIKKSNRGRSFFSSRSSGKSKGSKTYFQNFVMKELLESESLLSIKRKGDKQTKIYSYYGGIDFFSFSRDNIKLDAPVVFVGYGLDEKKLKFNEYKGIDVKGKFVMMFMGMPKEKDKDSPFKKGELKKKYYPQRYSRDSFSKFKIALDKGAVGVIMINESNLRMAKDDSVFDEKSIIPGKGRQISLLKSSSGRFGRGLSLSISEEIAGKIASLAKKNLEKLKEKINQDLKPQSFQVKGLSIQFENKIKYKFIKCKNVVGYIEGSDPELKDEVVVIGAHLDHLGKRGDYIFNGADDNGSGSVGVMEIAEAFALNKIKPKRSVLFALWTGEEKGLLGSNYYVENPIFPLKKTVCCLNLDMISRNHTKDRLKGLAKMLNIKNVDKLIKKIDIKKFFTPTISKSSNAIYETIKKNNRYVGLHLFIRKSERTGGGSDHAPFARKKIPIGFFMAGFREDYHQPTDSFSKVNTTLIQDISRLTFLTAFDLANK